MPRHNKENIPVMEQCNLTEEDRRKIRRKQRDLNRDIEEQDQLEVEEARDRNNEIYKDVRYTREAVLDGENLTLIATKATQQVERMIQVPRYDANRLVGKLVQKCRTKAGFDWASLGKEAGICFNAVPSGVCFLNGPLTDGKSLQVRQRTNRRAQEAVEEREAQEDRPEDVQGHTDRKADSLGSVEKSMVVLERTLRKNVDTRYKTWKRKLVEAYGGDEKEIPKKVVKKLKRTGAEICAVQYMFNPDSFTQTIENIFHFAFCVKKGSASIALRQGGEFNEGGLTNDGGPKVKYTDERKDPNTTAKQAIVSLTMKDWRKMCEAYNVTKGDLPHRGKQKASKLAASSQSSQDSA